MKIYTKAGDQGTTRLVDGSCVEKFNPRVEAYGTVDELNSQIGLLRCCLHKQSEIKSLDLILAIIQNNLFCLGSLLACEKDETFQKLPAITEKHIQHLEQKIDELSAPLPALQNFILPGGHEAAAQAHIARTICRRAERRSAEISMKDERYSNCLIYLNRLSDFLFVAARWINFQTKNSEVIWKINET